MNAAALKELILSGGLDQKLTLLYGADQLEMLVGKKYWPFPTYSDILFYV